MWTKAASMTAMGSNRFHKRTYLPLRFTGTRPSARSLRLPERRVWRPESQPALTPDSRSGQQRDFRHLPLGFFVIQVIVVLDHLAVAMAEPGHQYLLRYATIC